MQRGHVNVLEYFLLETEAEVVVQQLHQRFYHVLALFPALRVGLLNLFELGIIGRNTLANAVAFAFVVVCGSIRLLQNLRKLRVLVPERLTLCQSFPHRHHGGARAATDLRIRQGVLPFPSIQLVLCREFLFRQIVFDLADQPRMSEVRV